MLKTRKRVAFGTGHVLAAALHHDIADRARKSARGHPPSWN
ncbi:hypothetical protein [Mesorhizobium sp.]|nr:hypothetical protein [Mesorhizobium sp.]